MGEHTKYGGYKLDWEKIRTYVVPEGLKDTKVCVETWRYRALCMRASQVRNTQLLIMCIAYAVCDAADGAYKGQFQGHASD